MWCCSRCRGFWIALYTAIAVAWKRCFKKHVLRLSMHAMVYHSLVAIAWAKHLSMQAKQLLPAKRTPTPLKTRVIQLLLLVFCANVPWATACMSVSCSVCPVHSLCYHVLFVNCSCNSTLTSSASNETDTMYNKEQPHGSSQGFLLPFWCWKVCFARYMLCCVCIAGTVMPRKTIAFSKVWNAYSRAAFAMLTAYKVTKNEVVSSHDHAALVYHLPTVLILLPWPIMHDAQWSAEAATVVST